MKKSELDPNDYVRYERGTAPVRGFVRARDRDDHPNQRRKREAAEPRAPRPIEEPTSPIMIGLRKQERIEDERIRVKRAEIPFSLGFRPLQQDDFSFILNSWMLSYRDSRRDHNNTDFFTGQQNLIAEISKRRELIVGCDEEDPNWIAGFICGKMLSDGRLLLDYIYVKHAYRERGIARGLLSAIGWTQDTEIVATHWTRAVDKVARRYNASHNAYFNSMGYSDE